MTTTDGAPAPQLDVPDGPPDRARRIAAGMGRWSLALAGALAIFCATVAFRGADPVSVLTDMWTSTFLNPRSVAEIFIAAAAIILAALAVVVPARAGMSNVGGEGQVIVGAIAAAGTALVTDQQLPGTVVLALMVVAGLVGGAAWALIAGILRLVFEVNESVSTLLLNFVALYLLLFLIYQPWRADPSGQPTSRDLAQAARMPELTGTSGVTVGVVIAVVAAVIVWGALRLTRWGFALAVVGGNAEAARRAGLKVPALILSALLVGGALAGLAGMIQFSAVEFTLRPGFAAQVGYIGFLASWLARHNPIGVLAASFVFAALAVAGDSLQLDAGLPAATVNVLTALILIAVLGFTGTRAVGRR